MVNESLLVALAAFGRCGALERLAHHAFIMVIQCGLVTTHIAQHALEGIFCFLYRSIRREERLVYKHIPLLFMNSLHLLLISHTLGILRLASVAVFTDITIYIVTLRARVRSLERGLHDNGLRGGRSHLIVVVHKLPLMGTAVSGAPAPVIAHVIKHIVMTVIRAGTVQSTAHTPVTALIVCQQVMMERRTQSTVLTTTDGSRIAVSRSCGIVRMSRHVQSLTYKRALQGDILRTTRRKALVNSP